MKKRSNINTLRNDNESNIWQSFTDLFTNITGEFFLLMVFVMIITFIEYKKIKDVNAEIENIVAQRLDLYESIEQKLKPKLGDQVTFDKEQGKIEIKTELLFDFNSDVISKEGLDVPKKVGEAFIELFKELEKNEKEIGLEYIEIIGHTDNIGGGNSNRDLSVNRARTFVNAMLVPNSSDEKKYAKYFKASGMSKFKPKVGTTEKQNAEEQKQNRRIELAIKLNDKDIEDAIKNIISNKIKN